MTVFQDLLKAYIPTESSGQASSRYMADKALREGPTPGKVLDLGCGDGVSFYYFAEAAPLAEWTGIDIEPSELIAGRIGDKGKYLVYDGTHIPFEDNAFDLIYSNQVFEHVRYPATVLEEARRVLKPGHYFVGSTSNLEPYHAYSLWNYTPYGFSLLVEEAGLELLELRPRMDAFTMLLARGLGNPRFMYRWWEQESPVNRLIGLSGRIKGKGHAWINATKLLFCGQFVFLLRKPVD
jgi:SAM-dependent methyltransferase